MNIETLLKELSSLPEDCHICRSMDSDLLRNSEFQVVEVDEVDDPIVPSGFREFMDVHHAQEIVAGIRMQEGLHPTVDRFLAYLENDA